MNQNKYKIKININFLILLGYLMAGILLILPESLMLFGCFSLLIFAIYSKIKANEK